MPSTQHDLLTQGIDAVQRNQPARGARLLAAALRRNNANAEAWLWLARVVQTAEERRYCLQMVLELNPRLLDSAPDLHLTTGLARRPAVCNEQTGSLNEAPARAAPQHCLATQVHPPPETLRRIHTLTYTLASQPALLGRWLGYGERLCEELQGQR